MYEKISTLEGFKHVMFGFAIKRLIQLSMRPCYSAHSEKWVLFFRILQNHILRAKNLEVSDLKIMAEN